MRNKKWPQLIFGWIDSYETSNWWFFLQIESWHSWNCNCCQHQRSAVKFLQPTKICPGFESGLRSFFKENNDWCYWGNWQLYLAKSECGQCKKLNSWLNSSNTDNRQAAEQKKFSSIWFEHSKTAFKISLRCCQHQRSAVKFLQPTKICPGFESGLRSFYRKKNDWFCWVNWQLYPAQNESGQCKKLNSW